jgi:hypothetical protein
MIPKRIWQEKANHIINRLLPVFHVHFHWISYLSKSLVMYVLIVVNHPTTTELTNGHHKTIVCLFLLLLVTVRLYIEWITSSCLSQTTRMHHTNSWTIKHCSRNISIFRYAIVTYIDIDQTSTTNILVDRSLQSKRIRNNRLVETFDE